MRKLFFSPAVLRNLIGLLCLLESTLCIGCQGWHASTALPGLKTSRAQQKILQQLEHDPFPTPSEVGMKGAN